jgi:hypothetical protein
MSLISKDIANLTGGISQQAAPLRLYNQCEDQINLQPSLVNGLQNRAAVKTIAELDITEGAIYPIDRDDGGRYNLIIRPTGLTVIDESGVKQSVPLGTEALAYLSQNENDYYNTYKILTLADHTFILNTEKTARLTSDIYTPWKNQALVFIKQVQASTTWSLTIDGQTVSVGYGGVNNESGLPHLYVNGILAQQNVNMSTSDIATRLSGGSPAHTYYVQTTDTAYNSDKTYYFHFSGSYREITTAAAWATYKEKNNVYERVDIAATSGFSGFTITQSASTLWIRKNDGGAFSIGLSDTRSDTCSYLVTSKVQQFSYLPTVAPDGYICRVAGSIASHADDYYVMFVANLVGAFSKGIWEECAEPGSRCALDPATMPHKLVHNADGTWTFSSVAWAEKETGDNDSVPIPSFIDKKLRNIFLFRNRLCFITEDLLCMSAAADYENFWNETATTLTDADPIFISASTEKVADLYDCGVLDDDLIIFGSHGQYKLNAQDVLSPKTAAVTGIGKNAYAKGTGINASGARLYFGHQNGGYFVVSEFGTSGVTGNKEANSITSHVPCLIPFTKGCRMAGTENTDTIAVISPDTPDTLYMYQYYISGANRLQSAWHKFIITGSTIRGLYFRDNILWLFLVKNGRGVLATLDMAENTETILQTPVLDFLITQSEAEAKTVWTLPQIITPENAIVLAPTANNVLTPVTITAIDGNTITLAKTVKTIVAGEKIDRKYCFSTPYVATKQRDGTEKTDKTGRWQMHKLNLVCGLTGDFKVLVKPAYDDEAPGYDYQFSGIKMGTKSAALGVAPVTETEYQIPLRGRNVDLNVTIETSSHLPCTFISAQWQGNYITKVKQI